MNYKGFTIIRTCYGQWLVRVNMSEEWLADSEIDARQQVDDYLRRMRLAARVV